MEMERSGILLYANKMTKLTIVGLTAIMFIGCNGGGINLSEITKDVDDLINNLPKPPKSANKNSGKICSKTQLGCDMAYTIQSLPEEERLSCEWNYCQENRLAIHQGANMAKGEKVCRPSEKRYEQIEYEIIKEKKKHGITQSVSNWSSKYELSQKLEEPIRKFRDLCRYKIEDMPRDEYRYHPYIFLD